MEIGFITTGDPLKYVFPESDIVFDVAVIMETTPRSDSFFGQQLWRWWRIGLLGYQRFSRRC